MSQFSQKSPETCFRNDFSILLSTPWHSFTQLLRPSNIQLLRVVFPILTGRELICTSLNMCKRSFAKTSFSFPFPSQGFTDRRNVLGPCATFALFSILCAPPVRLQPLKSKQEGEPLASQPMVQTPEFLAGHKNPGFASKEPSSKKNLRYGLSGGKHSRVIASESG